MIDLHEQYIIVGYLQNILSRHMPPSRVSDHFDHLEESLQKLGVDSFSDEMSTAIDNFRGGYKKTNNSLRRSNKLRREIVSLLEDRKSAIADEPPGVVAKNIRIIAKELDLNSLEADLFALIVRYRLYESLLDFFDVTVGHVGALNLYATCLGCSSTELAKHLTRDSRLMTAGIIIHESKVFHGIKEIFSIPDGILSAMQKTMCNQDDVLRYILGESVSPTLEWDDFEHLGSTRDRLAAFVAEVTKQKIPGVNILLWGAPGTGKTEFTKTLAERLNLNLYTICEQDEEGDEPSRPVRISAYRLAQNLLSKQHNNLLLFDEMDDILAGYSLYQTSLSVRALTNSKIFINRLFENNPVPTIWIINDPSLIDQSVIRRMALVIEMKVPTIKCRKNVWNRILVKSGMDVPDNIVESLAETEMPPALASNAVKFAGLVGTSLDDFQFATQGIIKAMRGGMPQPFNPRSTVCIPEMINADSDVCLMARRMCTSLSKSLSLCLYGPPGTGKSAYVRFIAEQMEMKPLFKRTSDLISPYVGSSEKNIALAFEEARDNEQFLVFDEADSLLGDRRHARHSWEISQVNEMLTWMESHPLPFACTTNLKERLDQAAMRRFTLKCHFDYMRGEQIIIAFKHFFGIEIEAELAGTMQNLTPGDFAVVKKKVEFLGGDHQLDTLVELLTAEVAAKNEVLKKPLGFAT